MPTTNPLLGLFGKSPFKPLQAHMRLAAECAGIIPQLLAAVVGNNQQGLIGLADQISEIEHQADTIAMEIHSRLHKSLFLPVDRRDILDILEHQDDIADKAQDIAGMFRLRAMTVPPDMGDSLIAFAQRCVDACEKAAAIQEELDELMEMGFGGKPSASVLAMVEELNAIESETDRLEDALLRHLFYLEDQLKPVAVVIWYQIIDWIGDMADSAEEVGNRLRLILAR